MINTPTPRRNKIRLATLSFSILGYLMGMNVSAQSLNGTIGEVVIVPVQQSVKQVSFNQKPQLIVAEHAIIGIPLDIDIGSYVVVMTHEDNSTTEWSLEVGTKQYPEERITIEDTTQVTPPEETLERIRRESAAMRQVYGLFSNQPDMNSKIILPVEGRISGVFGSRRFFNDQPRNPHSGLDVAVPTGTPIHAPADAEVALTGDFYFNGNTVMLDHGGGFVSMMCHLDRIDVSQGDKVMLGDPIGTVGTTGRSTGPHLHWSVSLSADRVDPQVFMDQVNALFGGE